jgi:general secretion pathway protein F
MNFRYRAYLKDGRSDTGEFDAASKQDALRQLASKGLSVFELSEAKVKVRAADSDALQPSRIPYANSRVNFPKLFADLALLTGAGLTVAQSLRTMRSTETAPAQQNAVIGLLDKMSSGAGAAASFAAIKAIPAECLGMIASGENAGRLPEVFGALAAQYEERAKLKSQLLNALAYPLFLTVLMIVAIGVLTFALVPSIAPVFENSGQPPPFIVAVLSGLRAGLSGTCAMAAFAMAALLLLLSFLPPVRAAAAGAVQKLIVNLPLIGPIIRKSEQARYLSSFALLIGNGAPMAKALELAALSAVIPAFKTVLLGVRDSVSAGEKLPSALKSSGLFDHRIISLIAVGDEANRLPAVAKRASQILESEAQNAIMRRTALLTPIMTIFMGLLIGGLVVSVMTALLSINEIAVQ